jgi:hypothetical protein
MVTGNILGLLYGAHRLKLIDSLRLGPLFYIIYRLDKVNGINVSATYSLLLSKFCNLSTLLTATVDFATCSPGGLTLVFVFVFKL